jgi:hypothetical protein
MNLELEQATHWLIRDTQSFVVNPKSPLPEYLSAMDFSSNIICVFIDNSEALETWNFAGWLSQKITLPFGPGATGSVIADRRLWLQRKQVFIFPQLGLNYKIAISFPHWFTQASVTLWEYIGPQ